MDYTSENDFLLDYEDEKNCLDANYQIDDTILVEHVKKNTNPNEETVNIEEQFFSNDTTIYTFIGVLFPYAMQHYHYLTNDDTIAIGDNVVVPVGSENKEVIGRVVSVEKHLRVSAPFPVEKTKYVIRKYSPKNIPLKKMRLISNNVCYGPCPEENEEVEQHLTISSDGRVWFSRYNFGRCGKYEMREKAQINIGSEEAAKILAYIKDYFTNKAIEVYATDVGTWELTLTDVNGAQTIEKGSLISDPFCDENLLCNILREHLPFNDMFLFDGNYKED